jgi:hypothetical protein
LVHRETGIPEFVKRGFCFPTVRKYTHCPMTVSHGGGSTIGRIINSPVLNTAMAQDGFGTTDVIVCAFHEYQIMASRYAIAIFSGPLFRNS